MRSGRGVWPALALALGLGVSAAGQTPEEWKTLRKDVEALKQGQRALEKQLDTLLKALTRGQAREGPPPEVDLDITGLPALGDAKAKVTLVEFSDFQCGFCARYNAQTMPQIVADYVKSGKVRYLLRDFPLHSIHPAASKAAEAAHCAGEQGKYWEMRDRLLKNPSLLGLKDLPGHAGALSLDGAKFQQCLAGSRYSDKVKQGLEAGQKAGVDGTPTFFIGLASPGKPQLHATRTIVGAHPFNSFKEAIEALLATK